jgi:hypothetical protein
MSGRDVVVATRRGRRGRGRRIVLALIAGFALLVPAAATAQVGTGIHLARANDVLGGATGIGGRVTVGVPLVPLGAALSGDLFFPDCEDDSDCAYRAASLDVHFRMMPASPLTPVLLGGYSVRWVDAGAGSTAQRSGVGLGVGLELGLALGAYAEARYEFVDPEDQLVLRVGVLF